VKAIVWCVLPNVRKDALLTKQAGLIDLFKPGDIWEHVVIVCKQSRNRFNETPFSAAKFLRQIYLRIIDKMSSKTFR
jgi:hypothetical protein